MKLFRGLEQTDYQDVLWAVGLLLDERGYRNVRLIEHEEGMLVQAMPASDGQPSAHYQTFLLTDSDLEQLKNRAYQHLLHGARRQMLRRAYRQRANFVTIVQPDRSAAGDDEAPADATEPAAAAAPVATVPVGRSFTRSSHSAAAM